MRKKLQYILSLILNWLAKATLKKFKPVVIAVTGSAGKTSTKDAIFSVVSLRKRARCNVGNFNSEYGVPMTILANLTARQLVVMSRDAAEKPTKVAKARFFLNIIGSSILRLMFGWKGLYPEVLVLEYGADKPGDINYLTGIAKPNIAVVTAVGEIPVHVQFYQSPEAVAREKGTLVEALYASGLAILNGDENRVSIMQQKTRATALTFGFAENCDVRIIDFENKVENKDGVLKPIGITFKLGYEGAFVPVRINGTLGKAQAYAAAAAACVGLAFNMNLVDIAEQLIQFKPPAQRLQFLKGINESIIIDDSYNASPLSMKMAIETVHSIKAKRKVAIIGDMLELGEFAKEAHKEIGALAGKVFDVVVGVGSESAVYASEALKARLAKKNSISVLTVEEILPQLATIIKPGDLVLVKASHGVHLSRVVEAVREEAGKES